MRFARARDPPTKIGSEGKLPAESCALPVHGSCSKRIRSEAPRKLPLNFYFLSR